MGAGEPATFGTFGVVCALGALWLWRALPETAGKSLEEIEGLFVEPDKTRHPLYSSPTDNPLSPNGTSDRTEQRDPGDATPHRAGAGRRGEAQRYEVLESVDLELETGTLV